MLQTVILYLATTCLVSIVTCSSHGDEDAYKPEIVYQWNIVEYEWPNISMKEREISNGNYIQTNSAINGIKVYKKRVYVTVPRLKAGVPCTLGVVVENQDRQMANVSHVIRPFPNWDMQTLGNCRALQRVQSMEIDPQTGYMWIVDTGYIPNMESIEIQPLDACPAKIIIFDIQNHREIHRYEFPTSVVGQGLFYLNDVVLQYQNGKARYAYMSDTLAYKLVVYDYQEDTSYAFTHPTMRNDPAYQNVTISNITLTGLITGINGIGMSPDFRYLYYSSVAGVGLQQIETSVLRNNRGNNEAFANAVRTIGRKASMGDGMAYGAKHNLYFSALALNSVHKWDIKNDLNLDKDFGSVQLITQSSLTSDDRMQWVDTLAIDDCGYLWFTTSRLNKFFSVGSIQHHEPNFFIWKIYVDDYNYMDSRYHGNDDTLGGGCVKSSLILTAVSFILSIFMYKLA